MNSLGKFHFHIIYILYTPTYTPQSERDFLSKGKCLLWAKWPVRRSVRRRRAYRRTVRRTGPITGLYRTPILDVSSAKTGRPGGKSGAPACAPDHPAPGPAPPNLSPEWCFALPTAIFPPCLYIPFSYLQLGLGQPLFRAEALSLSLTPLLKHKSLRISHSTQPKANPFGRKQEEVPIYDSTKPYFIPP